MAHDEIKNQYDEVQAEGLYEEGMARMALYHRHCQDPVIFRALGNLEGKSLLDLACGDGFYTRKFRRAGADPVIGVDLSPQQIAKARRIEEREPLGIEYLPADVVSLELNRRFDLVAGVLVHDEEVGRPRPVRPPAVVRHDDRLMMPAAAGPVLEVLRGHGRRHVDHRVGPHRAVSFLRAHGAGRREEHGGEDRGDSSGHCVVEHLSLLE